MRGGLMTLVAVGALGRVGAAGAVEAEDPRPRRALTACAGGEVAKGVGILAELYADTREPTFVFNQGRCYQQNGQLERAADRFREYLRIGKDEQPADLARARGYLQEIDATLAARRAQPPPTGDTRPRSLRAVTIGLGALGLAAVGTGVFLSAKVSAQERAVEKRFGGDHLVTVAESQQLRNEIANGSRLETWQYVSYGVGIAALAGAATTIVLTGAWPWSGETSVAAVAWPGGAGAVVGGRF
jgi:hypothetical protein